MSTTSVPWTTDADGNIHFTLTSNGMGPEQWESYFENHIRRFSDHTRDVLRQAPEVPTNAVIYNIVVRPGRNINSHERLTKKIRAYAVEKGWKAPHWEVACIIRGMFTYRQLEQMGLCYIVTMHESIKDSDGLPYLLCSNWQSADGCPIDAEYDEQDDDWSNDSGFAFEIRENQLPA